MNRTLNVTTPLGPELLRFDGLQGRESLSQLFDFQLSLKSEEKGLSADDLLGQPITVDFELEGGARRHLNGQCVHFRSAGRRGKQYLYIAQLKPWLWYATRRSDYRIFQGQSTPDIVRQVLGLYPFQTRWLLSRSYRNWTYCVQYRETDANFVQRLLEHEGIWFWFDHSAGEHTLVLTDDIGLAGPYPGYATIPFYPHDHTVPDKDHLHGWAASGQVQSGRYSARDYNFVMPSADLTTLRNGPAAHPHASYDIFDYPGSYPTLGEGDPYARTRLEELQAGHKRSHGTGRARGLAPGRLFTLERHAVAGYNREYLVVGADYDFSDNDYEANQDSSEHRLGITAEFHPTDQPFRPERRTPKPHTMGPESAVVTGPAGQEIFTDEHGRVKVQFHWDRYGRKDENSSCWIRVSHPWAGTGFGSVHIPRIGQEVLVDHLNGDPDQPIIVGRVYNTNNPHPWNLPANATQSGFLTRSSMGATWQNANAFRFEDKRGEEQVWLHAEKNQDIEVENDETHWVGHDRTKTIDHDETVHVKHDRTETVDHDETITVHNNRTETVDGHETITIHKNRTEVVDGNETITVHKNRTETVDQNETISVHQNRTRTVDGNETVTVHKNRSKTVDKSETDKIGKNWSIKVGRMKTETIGVANIESIGLARMSNIGMAYSLNVGMVMNTVVGMQQSSQIGSKKTVNVGKTLDVSVGEKETRSVGKERSTEVGTSDTLTVGERHSISVGQVQVTSVGDHLELACGAARIVLKSDGGIYLSGTHIEIQGAQAINADGGLVQINCGASQAAPAAPPPPEPPQQAPEAEQAGPMAALGELLGGSGEGNVFGTLGKIAGLAAQVGIGGPVAGVAASALGALGGAGSRSGG
ncbi:type VI secretion system secreted protein VgrG [Tahibacter aquaticus]|uniref:Type VI secretion system secreted protein VgrG n=1 Tax=Tahibacter aquaticus TaxID=520092 RepID=A0A4R6Z6R7_9GAMM|nr:type VI secretion system tip protein VgrG [Tahibacter aquaticus]TDR47461.1 type VI secretion system secreted protein VgrG [Tahibacter aquaticus]